jgi:hypothetical protein
VVVNPPASGKPERAKPAEKVGPAVRINPPAKGRKKPKKVKPIVGRPPRPARGKKPPPNR